MAGIDGGYGTGDSPPPLGPQCRTGNDAATDKRTPAFAGMTIPGKG
jgi:hypothetical protein